MSKMNRIRIVNLNYNRNTIRIDDETFDLNGESTLISLRNGGGKTVLVQMITALFVNKSYRDLSDRSFASYFTTNKPSFIMVEWKLDHGAGYFLTGMMVRKNQEPEENEPLEILTYTSDYKGAQKYNLDELPIIEETNGRRMLRGFGSCKKELELLKKESGGHFNYYDMDIPYQRKNYFSKMNEYGINHREWETIIKKVNIKESGLSELFTNAKDEAGLVEKWMLYSIENKLNQSGNRVKNFQKLAYKLIEQYRKNENSIRRKEVFDQYFEDITEFEQALTLYEEVFQKQEEKACEIGQFIVAVRMILEELSEQETEGKERFQALEKEWIDILYEKCSYRLYELKEEKQDQVSSRIESEMQISTSKSNIEKYDKEICKMECSRLYGEWKDFSNSIKEYESKRDALLEEQKDTEKERESLAGQLYSYYQNELKQVGNQLKGINEDILSIKKDMDMCIAEQKEELASQIRIEGELGSEKQKLHNYDAMEQDYNGKYSENLMRNIIGEYEEGVLPLRKREYEEQQRSNSVTLRNVQEKITAAEQTSAKLQEELVNLEKRGNTLAYEEEQTKNAITILEETRSRRMRIMHYVNLDEKYIDDTEQILTRLHAKEESLGAILRDFNRDLSDKQHSYDNLKQGKLLELPDYMKLFFEEHDIRITYGMEWLKNNGKNYRTNQKFVKENPFIPYSLILGKNDMEKLKKTGGESYTSFPIPMILREELEQSMEKDAEGIISLGAVTFYIMFNQHLLNPKELEQMLDNMKAEILDIKERIAVKNQELREYQDKIHEVEHQDFQMEKLEKMTEKLQMIISQREQTKEEIIQNKKEAARQKEEKEKSEKKKESLWLKGEILKEKIVKYDMLCKAYEEYLVVRERIHTLEYKKTRAKEKLDALQIKEKEQKNQIDILQEKSTIYRQEEKETGNKCTYYKPYINPVSRKMSLPEEAEKMVPIWSGRFEVLLNGLGRSLKEIEADIVREQGRLASKEKELKRKNIYSFAKEEYQNVYFLEEGFTRLEEDKREAEKEYNAAIERNSKLNESIARLNTSIEYEKKDMMEKTGHDEPKKKKEIVDTKFDTRIKLVEFDLNAEKKRLKQIEDRIAVFSNVDSAMAEYADFVHNTGSLDDTGTVNDTVCMSLKNLSKDELNDRQGALRRTYKQGGDAIIKEQKKTDRILKSLSEKSCYQDEYFVKCFRNLMSLIEDVGQLRKQSETNKQSFDTLRKKLESDLASIDRDKKNIEEFFLEYVRDLDENMRMIDKNSTIHIRGRSIKMLKIQVPSWQENEELYKLRIGDFVEGFIKRGMDVLNRNENVEEMLGKVITTKNIYNDVVGIGQIGIKLYKIEAEREVPITWAEVSANSGGEGFLSAFVILSCLLSYMRRDETDLFAMGEEGKVLIMDNPFAQTYSEHLLKPLMEIAKKTNTQLICLSGLGGGNIYNRFNNIYVINLVQSGLHKGMEYAKIEHKRGEDIKKMRLSQFEAKQMSLFDIL